MPGITRRTLINNSLGLAAAGTLARPFVANAQAKTITVWWVQGFVPQEDAAFRELVAEYEKKTGDKIAYSIVPFAPLRQKIVSAITSGVVPDLIYATPPEVVPEQAWAGRLEEMSDVLDTQKSKMLPIAAASAICYNNVEKKHGVYGVPFEGAVVPFHIWGSLVEKAGHKLSDIPGKWDQFIDFFPPVAKKLQSMGMRHTYASAFVISTIGNDPTNTFQQFMLAYGGANIVGKDGKFNGKDPKVHDSVVRAVDKLSTLFKNGAIPPSSVNWNDADDNNAFHSKLAVMDFDGTLSTELAMLRTPEGKQAYYHEVITNLPSTGDLPLDDNGEVMTRQFGVNYLMIPKGAKNVQAAKEFSKYIITPEINGKFLKGGLGRWLPVFPELVKNDPFWTDPKQDPHRPPYVKEAFGGAPLVPYYYIYNPAWAQVRTEHPFNVAIHDVTAGGMKPADAVTKAFKRIDDIFIKYEIKA
jgi:multiple sugar transport system substrate-binding protein